MNEVEVVKAIEALGIPSEHYNLLGPPRDFAYNLVIADGGFDLYWLEKGLQTRILSNASFETASRKLIEELRKEFL